MYYVKGNDDGSASVVWGIIIGLWNYGAVLDTPNKVKVGKRESSNSRSRINIKQNVSPNLIFDKLQIEKGETKIIIESCLSYSRNSRYFWGNGTSCSKISERQAFGFNLISPKGYTRSGTKDSAYFHSTVIFTPKLGLFDENAPV